MRFIRFEDAAGVGLAVEVNGEQRGLHERDSGFPGPLSTLVGQGREALKQAGERLAAAAVISGAKYLPPFPTPPKIICVGLNYARPFRRVRLQAARLSDAVHPLRHQPGRPRRARRAAQCLRQARLRGRASRRDRQGRAPYLQRLGARSCRRLFDLQRRLGARLPVQIAAMDRRQEFRRHRPVRPGVRHRRRTARRAARVCASRRDSTAKSCRTPTPTTWCSTSPP